jgi:ABC-2 type transport system permease protein
VIDLWNNPRARLLASVPFVLAILLKVLSGRALFVYLLGGTADATVMGGLAVYGAVVMASTFSQNAFAYDGHGFAVFLAAPMALGDVLRAKNLVHASAGLLLALLVTLFYLVYFRAGSALDVACALAGVVAMVPVLLFVGNFLSVFFPVKFHANLKRRDKLPFLASMIGIGAASVGAAPFGLALKLQGKDGPALSSLGLILGAAAINWVLYRALLPVAVRLLEQRREVILRSVTRD